MAEDASLELQRKHIIGLRADVPLQAFIAQRVFNYLPRRTNYPFVVYDISDTDEWDYAAEDTNVGDGEIHMITIHAFSDAEGDKQSREILQAVHELLQNNTTFALTDHNLVNVRRTGKDMVREGQVYHGIGLYRAVTEET